MKRRGLNSRGWGHRQGLGGVVQSEMWPGTGKGEPRSAAAAGSGVGGQGRAAPSGENHRQYRRT